MLVACAACSFAFDVNEYTGQGDVRDSLEGGAGGSSSGAPPGSSSSSSSGGASGALPTNGRLITFEDGALVHPATGVDSTTGSPFLVAGAGALIGEYSLGIDGHSAHVRIDLKPMATLFLSFYVRLNQPVPAGGTLARIVLDQPDTSLSLSFTEESTLAGVYEGGGADMTFGVAPLPEGAARRVGFHYYAGPTQGEVSLFAGDGAGPMNREGTSTFTSLRSTVSAVEIGALNQTAMYAVIDDIRIALDSFGP